jgi:threonine aldolase
MVYISNPTEWGTLYSLRELKELSAACRELGLYLFLDGARLGYGLMAGENDVTMEDLARLCDVFYIGGTKVGALFGEAVVISNPVIREDFRYVIKQRGAMLAKGRLLGVQFDALMTDDLYFRISREADRLADILKEKFASLGCDFFMPPQTNQLFPILGSKVRQKLAQKYTFIEMDPVGDDARVCRFCTSWATREENVAALCEDLEKIFAETES